MTTLKPFLAPTAAFALFVASLALAPFAVADQIGTDDPAVSEERVEQILDQDVDNDGCVPQDGVCVGAGED